MRTNIFMAIAACLTCFSTVSAQKYAVFNNSIHVPLSQIKEVRTSWQVDPRSLSVMIENDENAKLFCEALNATGLMDSLKCYKDKTYSVGADSIDWTNDALVIPTATEYDNVAYMYQRMMKHTMFVETDEVLKAKGVSSLEDLEAKAHELYDPMYPEDAYINDKTDRRNALNRFVAYHILPFGASYYQLTCVDGPNSTLAVNWNRRKIDISDWYETMAPYSTMKFSFPNGSDTGLYINRRGVQSRADERGVFVRGAKVSTPTEMDGAGSGVNGMYYYIDDIIAYGQNTQQVVLNERMRIDCSTLSPDFITSGARGHYTRSSYENGKYGIWDATSNHNNRQTCLGFKEGSAKNVEFKDSQTHLHVRPRTLSFWSYGGDEVAIVGQFDVSVKLPPLPAGIYEVRLGTCVEFSNRGIVMFYIDEVPTDLVDMRPGGKTLFGWKSDTSLGDEEIIERFDRTIHKKGWMKGPKSYYSATSESGGTQGSCFRDLNPTLRKVIGTFFSNGQTDHYLRMKQVIDSSTSALAFDYIELVPKSVYDDEYYVEDRW